MLGAVVGDLIGGVYERTALPSGDVPLRPSGARFSDDTVLTLAVADALMMHEDSGVPVSKATVRAFKRLGRLYPEAGYGPSFFRWLMNDVDAPYGSYGNGAVMRVAPCADVATTLDDAMALATAVTGVTHDHPDALFAARTIAMALVKLKRGASPQSLVTLRDAMVRRGRATFGRRWKPAPDEMTCVSTSSLAFDLLFASHDFESALTYAVGLGGDGDTLCAVTGALAEACYGMPNAFAHWARSALDERLGAIADRFLARHPVTLI